MDLAALETFVTVARYQNIHKAAKELHLSQPAITARIHTLESQFGCKLFEKSGRRIQLTNTGKILYPYVIHSLQILNSGMERIQKESIHKYSNRISVAADPDSMHLLAQLAGYITQKIGCPFEWEISEIPFARLYEELTIGNVKIAMTSKEFHHPQFRTFCMNDEQVLFVVQPQWLKTNPDAPFAFILNPNDPFFSNVHSHISAPEFAPFISSVTYVEHQSMVKQLVCSGAGCGFLPKSVIEPELSLGQIQILSTAEFPELKFLDLNYPQYIVYSTDLPTHIQQILCSFYLEYDSKGEPS